MKQIDECERLTREAIRKFQRLNAARQNVMLERMDAIIDGEKEADIKEILIKLKTILLEVKNEK